MRRRPLVVILLLACFFSKTAFSGAIVIDSVPAGALVTINGKIIGNTPVRYEGNGKIQIDLELGDYDSESKFSDLSGDKVQFVKFPLVQCPVRPRNQLVEKFLQ